jgi:hypothetical protein
MSKLQVTDAAELASNSHRFDPNQEQDDMIAGGVKFLCRKLVDLVNLADEHGLDFDSSITFSQIKHSEWVERMLSIVENLKSWELKNNGELSFSKAFDLLSVKLSVSNTERKKLVKNSSSRKVIENGHFDFS